MENYSTKIQCTIFTLFLPSDWVFFEFSNHKVNQPPTDSLVHITTDSGSSNDGMWIMSIFYFIIKLFNIGINL